MALKKNCNLLLRPALKYLLFTLQVVYNLLNTHGACFWLIQEKQNFLIDFPTGLPDQNFFRGLTQNLISEFC